jgi:ribosomal protein L29
MKAKEIREMKQEERNKKLKELKMELIKSGANEQNSNSKKKEIKKTIAKILTINKSEEEKK